MLKHSRHESEYCLWGPLHVGPARQCKMSWQGRVDSGNTGDWVLGVTRKPSKSQAVIQTFGQQGSVSCAGYSHTCGQRVWAEADWLTDGWTFNSTGSPWMPVAHHFQCFHHGSRLVQEREGPSIHHVSTSALTDRPLTFPSSPNHQNLAAWLQGDAVTDYIHVGKLAMEAMLTRQDFTITCLFSLVCGTTSQFCPVHRFCFIPAIQFPVRTIQNEVR